MHSIVDLQIEEFKEISLKYDAFIIDLWGVIHNGFVAYTGSVECINHLIEIGKPIIFMSNAPRPNTVVLKKLLELEINANLEMVLTSGDTTRIFLIENLIKTPNKKYYHLGAHRNTDLLIDINICLTEDIQQCDAILLTAYIDEHEDLEQFNDILKQAADLKIPIICSNPDKIVINGVKNRYCAGFLAEKYEMLGGTVYYYGKPHLTIYDIGLDKLKLKGIYDKNKILMIGDTLETDIQGAINVGIKSALVLTGNTNNLLIKYNQLTKTKTETLKDLLDNYKIYPTHVISGLRY